MLALAAGAACLVLILLAPPASATLTMQGNCPAAATAMGQAIVDQAGLFVGASWYHYPGAGGCPPASGCTSPANPAATSNAQITTVFGPPVGPDFAILSSGAVACAPTPNTSGSTSGSFGDSYSGGNDVSILKVDINVPAGANYLFTDAQFMSEEYPEYVGSFSDALLAELDATTWSASGFTISAPKNFAFDCDGDMMFVGSPHMSLSNAAGSTYDGATGKEIIRTPITPGFHSVYFSIFDTLDSIYDSTAFLDNMRTKASNSCVGDPPPIADFKFLFTTTGTQLAPGYAGPYDLTYDPVQFTDLSVFPPADGATKSWVWTFGDGYSDAAQHPQHQYIDNGVYNVCLTVTQWTPASGAQSDVICKSVTVHNRPPSGKYQTAAAPNSGYIHFMDIASDLDGIVVGWTWNFGDGGTFVGRFPHHLFADVGTYNVCLTVVDDDGATATWCKDVTIEAKDMPDADLDGVWDRADDCPNVADHDQVDSDHDGLGDACDPDYAPPGSDAVAPAPRTLQPGVDSDHDGIEDLADDCPFLANADQADLDGDGNGDGCDADVDGDGIPNFSADPEAILDNCARVTNRGQEDVDGDGLGDACDTTPYPVGIGDRVGQAEGMGTGDGAVASDAPFSLQAVAANPVLLAVALAGLVLVAALGVGLSTWAVRRWR